MKHAQQLNDYDDVFVTKLELSITATADSPLPVHLIRMDIPDKFLNQWTIG